MSGPTTTRFVRSGALGVADMETVEVQLYDAFADRIFGGNIELDPENETVS